MSTQAAGTTARASDDDLAGLARVRRRDVRAAGHGAAVPSPAAHGDEGDPRYPSPRVLRETIGFAVDVVLHVGGAAAVFMVTLHALPFPRIAGLALLWGTLAFLVLSIGDRIVLQRFTGTTVGKALVGLCVIRRDNGERPTVRQLIREWLWGIVYVIGSILD